MIFTKQMMSLTLLIFIYSEFNAQTTLYARADGDWNNNNVSTGTWSTVSVGGISCGCIPGVSDSVVIDGYQITLSSNEVCADLTVKNNGHLFINNNIELNLRGNSSLNLTLNGTITHSGNGSNSNIKFQDGEASIHIDSNSNFNISNLITEDSCKLVVYGPSKLIISDNLLFSGKGSTISMSEGCTSLIEEDLWFDINSENNSFINYGRINFEDDITIFGKNNIICNNDSISVSDDIKVLDTNCTIYNNLNSYIESGDDLKLQDGSHSNKIKNSGTISIAGSLRFEGTNDTLINSGQLSTLGKIQVSDKDFDDNAVYNLSNGEIIIENDLNLNDADFVFDNYGQLTLKGKFHNFGGLNSFFNREGATITYFGTHYFSTNKEIRLFADSGANLFNYARNDGSMQRIIPPQDAYHELTLSGSGLKETYGDLFIKGDLLIGGTSTLDPETRMDNIYIAGNWKSNSNFNEGVQLVTFNGDANQYVSSAGSEIFFDLEVNKASGQLILEDSIEVKNSLQLSEGQIDLNGQVLYINNTAATAISRTDGSIISENTNNASKITWNIENNPGSFIFPFTKNDGTYIPFTFELTGGNMGNVSVSTYPTNQNNQPLPVYPDSVENLNSVMGHSPDNSAYTVDRFWQIDKTGNSGVANITFTYAQSEVTGFVNEAGHEQFLEAQRYDTTLNKWDPAPINQITNEINNTVFVPAVSNFSPYSLALLFSPLPITLNRFEVYDEIDAIRIEWETSSEVNNDYFLIEKSTNANHWIPLAKVEGRGNSNKFIKYLERDPNPFEGLSYYRLKQVDLNGSKTTSEIKSVNHTSLQNQFSVYPNPASDFIYINSIKKIDSISIYDSMRREPISKHDIIQISEHEYKIDISKIDKGMYIINSQNFSKKIIKN